MVAPAVCTQLKPPQLPKNWWHKLRSKSRQHTRPPVHPLEMPLRSTVHHQCMLKCIIDNYDHMTNNSIMIIIVLITIYHDPCSTMIHSPSWLIVHHGPWSINAHMIYHDPRSVMAHMVHYTTHGRSWDHTSIVIVCIMIDHDDIKIYQIYWPCTHTYTHTKTHAHIHMVSTDY